jgi:hypothetical protein
LLDILLRAVEASVVMISHTFLGGLMISCMWGIHRLIQYLGGGTEMLLFDSVRLDYVFIISDLAIVIVIGTFGVYETIESLKRK